jgi:hypothetical protein
MARAGKGSLSRRVGVELEHGTFARIHATTPRFRRPVSSESTRGDMIPTIRDCPETKAGRGARPRPVEEANGVASGAKA